MDWVEYSAARKALTEEFVGAPVREAQRNEAAEAKASRKALESRR